MNRDPKQVRAQRPATPRSEGLRQQELVQADAALRAIRAGTVDHVVVTGPDGPAVFRLLSTKELELQHDLREAQALAKLGTWTFKDGRLHWSQQMYVLHGRDEALGPPDRDDLQALFQGPRAAFLPAALDLALKTGRGFDLELELAGPGARWCRMHAEASKDPSGRITGLRGTAQDMTVTRKAEAERERVRFLDIEVGRLKGLNEMRSDFLNAAAHDLNNPLTPILLQLSAMTKAAGADEGRQAGIKLLQRNVKRLQVIIQDMLDSSRLQSGGMTIRRAPCDLHALLSQAIESFESVAAASHITLGLEPRPPRVASENDPRSGANPGSPVDRDPATADRSSDLLLLDEERIGQVVYNLLSNAIKYTPDGGKVDVSLSSSKGHVRVSVTDSGLGMTHAQIERLFQPFVRLHEHVDGSARGTGLGLYICKGLVEAHGGRLWATSPGPGEGSTFTVELPTGDGS